MSRIAGRTTLRARLREIANERRRFGYRQLAIPQEPNQRWSLEFGADSISLPPAVA